MMNRVFQIGFNKCGTKAIHNRLLELGFRSVHYDQGRLAMTIKQNVDRNKYILNGLEDFDAFTDMNCHTTQYWIEAHNYFDIFRQEVPGARFILNTRDKNDWIASRMEHGGGKIVKAYMEVYGVNRIEDVERCWSDEWDAHHERVYRTIPANNLLILNLDKQAITKIDEFLGVIGPKPVNPRVGYTPTLLHDLVRETTPDCVKRLVPRSMKKRIAYTLRKRR